jgi:hypothetical protein
VDEQHGQAVEQQASEGLAKYRELYESAKELLADERDRYARLDQKAATYLSALTLAFSFYALVAASFLKDLPACLAWYDWPLLALATAVPCVFLVSWVKVFLVLRVQGMSHAPLDVAFFDANRLIDIYYAMARGMSDALRANRKASNSKSEHLKSAYNWIICLMVMLVVFLLAYGAHRVCVHRGV